ncbi:hypothetical protein DPMN_123557 [Dreissena polymorpha]|uniref:Uncharacterized protein n=1 Tax=Dreissena polymorpha TaxID=45954 RepID=A0A9D4GUN7_DREPO|nr:hypothetical protein DPMN_123557 [Dreissena polymorpha]
MDAIHCFICKNQSTGDKNIQQIAGALRASVNRSTGFTANMLMLGREVNTPTQLLFPHVSCRYDNQDEYVSMLIEDI